MGYIHDTFKVLLLAIYLISFNETRSIGQTCCSGGVPLSGNIGFEGSDRGTFQGELSYDLNYLANLKSGRDLIQEKSRKRITQSAILKAGYSFSDRFAVDALFSYVFQYRGITNVSGVNEVRTNGIGDAVVITKFILSRIQENGLQIQFGAGPKFPLGKSSLTDSRGITFNADMQPGSGSWDIITWGYFAWQLKKRPTAVVSSRLVGRFNGKNPYYLGSETYRFGNSFQLFVGIGDQLIMGHQIISPSLSIRFRKAFPDQINEIDLDNTGGAWLNLIPAFGWHLGQHTILNVIPEIPVYSNIEGFQLTPTFRIQVGIYYSIGGRRINSIETQKL